MEVAGGAGRSEMEVAGEQLYSKLKDIHRDTQIDAEFYKNEDGSWDIDGLQQDIRQAQAQLSGMGLPDDMSSIGGDARAYEQMVRPSAVLPILQHRKGITVDKLQKVNYEAALNNIHLMQTDNDVQPVMGAVHMVRPSSNFHDRHFMVDIEGDINEGQRVMLEKSRRGPFRYETGRSTVMDRSANVTYRKRNGAMEITVKRGCIRQEMEQLLRKLVSHRLSTFGSLVTLIKGTRRYRLGKLQDINMRYLRELVEECIEQYGNCGIEITESSQAGRGSLYKSKVHGARFKSAARRRKGGLESLME